MYSIGWQKSYGSKNKLRLNPNSIVGEFSSSGITDGREQFYRVTSLGIYLHYDAIRYKAFSIVTTGGVFINYSRGLLEPHANTTNYQYFNSLYFGGVVSFGIRVNPKNSKFAYEFNPVNAQLGSDDFLLGYLMFGIDFKLKKNNQIKEVLKQ